MLCCVSGLSLVVGGAEVAADYPANKLLGVEGKPENICRTPASGGCQDGKHRHRRLKHTQKEAAGEVEEEGRTIIIIRAASIKRVNRHAGATFLHRWWNLSSPS